MQTVGERRNLQQFLNEKMTYSSDCGTAEKLQWKELFQDFAFFSGGGFNWRVESQGDYRLLEKIIVQ